MHGVVGPCLGVGMAGMHGFLCTPCMPATYQKLQSNLGSGKVLFPTIDKIWAYCPIGSRMLYLFCALNIKIHFDHLSSGKFDTFTFFNKYMCDWNLKRLLLWINQ